MRMKKQVCVLVLVLITMTMFYFAVRDDDQKKQKSVDDAAITREEVEEESKTPIIDTAKSMFSMPQSLPTSSVSNWMKLKTLFKQGRAYFSSPNIDFRGGSEERGGTEEGAREKVKEAVAKSLEESVSVVEDSAKSAAHLAEEAMEKMEKTVKKVTKTLSGKGANAHPQQEEL